MGCGGSKPEGAAGVAPVDAAPAAVEPAEPAAEPAKEEEALFEGTDEENAAAAKIQAGFRGHKTRKEMKKGKDAAPPAEPAAASLKEEISALHEFAKKTRFTAEGKTEHDAKVAALEEQLATLTSAPAAAAPSADYVDDAPFENGHAQLADAFALHKSKWAAMNAKATPPAAGAAFQLALIADQDEASNIGEKTWESYIAFGSLTYNGDTAGTSYSLTMNSESLVDTHRGDKSGRGAEYSALEVFDGKLLTFCDRTGDVDELVLSEDDAGKTVVTVKPLVNGAGESVKITMGDGSNGKPLKLEWTTQKGGKLVIGSTGKERTDDDGAIVHEGEMWCKTLSAGPDYTVTHVDARTQYNGLRAAANCPQGAGYMIHESGRWSAEHNMWFFAPRKLSRKPYDEVIDASKCVNLMFAAPDPVAAEGVIMQKYLGFTELRGCSDFMFVPGSNDCHLFVLRTEESLDNVVTSYAAVIDLEGNTLMAEVVVGRGRKFEGASWIDGFNHFKGDAAPPTTGECIIA